MWSVLRNKPRATILSCTALVAMTTGIVVYSTSPSNNNNKIKQTLKTVRSSLSSLFPRTIVHTEPLLPNDTSSEADKHDYMIIQPRMYSSAWDDNWDKRKPKTMINIDDNKKEEEGGKGGRKKRVVRHLYLIRHGQYVSAEDDKDRVLTKLGREQAESTGKRIAGMGVMFDRLYYSTMSRATETGQLISAQIPLVPTSHSDLLVEGAPIAPIPSSLSGWRPSESDFYVDGARIEAAFRTHFYRPMPDQEDNTHEIIVCHGNVIRYFICRALQIPPEMWLRMSLAHCSVTRVDLLANGRVSVRSLGDMGHLTAEQQTFV